MTELHTVCLGRTSDDVKRIKLNPLARGTSVSRRACGQLHFSFPVLFYLQSYFGVVRAACSYVFFGFPPRHTFRLAFPLHAIVLRRPAACTRTGSVQTLLIWISSLIARPASRLPGRSVASAYWGCASWMPLFWSNLWGDAFVLALSSRMYPLLPGHHVKGSRLH